MNLAVEIPPPQAVDIAQLLTAAVERGVPVESMERLMSMRQQIKAEAAKEAFDAALAAFQADCPTIEKRKQVMNKDGRTVRYSYAPLDSIVEQVKGLLQQHGFSYSVDTEAVTNAVKAICKITHRAGHSQQSSFQVPIEPGAFMSAPQQFAAALTFAKRYAFTNAFGILTGDEDTDGKTTKDKPEGPSKLQSDKPEAKTLFTQLWELLKSVRGTKNNWDTANEWLRAKTLIGEDETCQRMDPKRMAKLIEDVKKVL